MTDPVPCEGDHCDPERDDEPRECHLQVAYVSLGVRVMADEVGIEHLVDYLRLALSEGLLVKATHGGLVHYRHRGLLSPLLLSVLEPYPLARGLKRSGRRAQAKGANF
jgi:hypothetical protein